MDYRDCRGALRVSIVLVREFPESDAVETGYQLIQTCLHEISRSELQDLVDHPPTERVAAKAILVMASFYRGSFEECPQAILLYERIESRYSRTPEAWRATTQKVVNCLVPMGRDHEAILALEQVIERARPSPEAAWALNLLAQLHTWRGDREAARAALTRLIHDYPRDLEYPRTPGIKIVRSAEMDLKHLSQYLLSPFLDQVVHRAARLTGLDRSPWDSSLSWALWGIVGLVRFVTCAVGLGAVLVLLGVARLSGASSGGSGVRLFVKDWSLPKVSALLFVLWGLMLLVEVADSLAELFNAPSAVIVGLWIYGGRVAEVVVAIVALGA